MSFWSYWKYVYNKKDKPESGNVTFGPNGEVINHDEGSRGEHTKYIKDATEKAVKEIRETVDLINKEVKEATKAAIDAVEKAKNDIVSYKDESTNDPKKFDTIIQPEFDLELPSKTEEVKTEKVVKVTEDAKPEVKPAVQDPVANTTPEPSPNLVEQLIKVFKK